METGFTPEGLHYVTVGSGSPCLVAHGGPGLHHGLYRSLDPLAVDRMLVFWDHRGHGRSAPLPPGPIDMALFADDAVALADHLGIQVFSIFGHSFGGWVAQELVLRHPDRISAAVFAATTPGQLGTGEPPDIDQGPPMPAEVLELLTGEPESDDEVVDRYTKLAPHFLRGHDTAPMTESLSVELASADSMRRVMDALARWSSVDRLGEITCPTLVIAGRHDVFCSPEQLIRIASRVRTAVLEVFESSGHFMWIEEPDAFFELVGSWLSLHRAG